MRFFVIAVKTHIHEQVPLTVVVKAVQFGTPKKSDSCYCKGNGVRNAAFAHAHMAGDFI